MTDEQPPESTGAMETQPVPDDESVATVSTPISTEHPYRERYLVPFVFPLLIVVAVVFYVLNISRLFLASKGTAALVLASVMTALILFGATALAAAPKMRSSSLGLILVGVLVVIGGAGWITVGHAEEKKAATVTLPPPVGAIEVTVPANQLKFNPDKFQVPLDPASAITAIQITYHDAGAGQHTFDFDDPTVIWKTLEINNAGEKLTETAGFPKAGDYTFYCAIPGHRAAGMQGTITVTNSVKPQKVKAAPTTTSGA